MSKYVRLPSGIGGITKISYSDSTDSDVQGGSITDLGGGELQIVVPAGPSTDNDRASSIWATWKATDRLGNRAEMLEGVQNLAMYLQKISVSSTTGLYIHVGICNGSDLAAVNKGIAAGLKADFTNIYVRSYKLLGGIESNATAAASDSGIVNFVGDSIPKGVNPISIYSLTTSGYHADGTNDSLGKTALIWPNVTLEDMHFFICVGRTAVSAISETISFKPGWIIAPQITLADLAGV